MWLSFVDSIAGKYFLVVSLLKTIYRKGAGGQAANEAGFSQVKEAGLR